MMGYRRWSCTRRSERSCVDPSVALSQNNRTPALGINHTVTHTNCQRPRTSALLAKWSAGSLEDQRDTNEPPREKFHGLLADKYSARRNAVPTRHSAVKSTYR